MSWGIDVDSELELSLDSGCVKCFFAFLQRELGTYKDASLVVVTNQASHLSLRRSETTSQTNLAAWRGGISTGCTLALAIMQL